MATGQAALEGVQLVNEVVELAKANSPSSFAVAQYRKRAEALRRTDLFHASIALGMIGAIIHDMGVMRTNHERALQLQPGNFVATLNFASSLQKMKCFSESREMSLRAYRLEPGNPFAVFNAINICVATLRFSIANDLILQWKKIRPHDPAPHEDVTNNSTNYFREFNIEETEAEKLTEVALEVLRENNVYPTAWDVNLLSDEDSRWLSYDLIVGEPVERVLELNANLIRRLFADPRLREVEDRVLVMYLAEEK
jgi:hypothetical protein